MANETRCIDSGPCHLERHGVIHHLPIPGCRGQCGIERAKFSPIWPYIQHAADQGVKACIEVIERAGP